MEYLATFTIAHTCIFCPLRQVYFIFGLWGNFVAWRSVLETYKISSFCLVFLVWSGLGLVWFGYICTFRSDFNVRASSTIYLFCFNFGCLGVFSRTEPAITCLSSLQQPPIMSAAKQAILSSQFLANCNQLEHLLPSRA